MTGEDHLCESKIYTFPTPNTGIKQIEQFNMSPAPRKRKMRKMLFFPSNARWVSPGRLSSRKDNCIVQIHWVNAAATLVIMTIERRFGENPGIWILPWTAEAFRISSKENPADLNPKLCQERDENSSWRGLILWARFLEKWRSAE